MVVRWNSDNDNECNIIIVVVTVIAVEWWCDDGVVGWGVELSLAAQLLALFPFLSISCGKVQLVTSTSLSWSLANA